MGLDAKKVLAICQQYTDDSVEGAGAIKGKPCQIQSITEITGGHRVTFVWEKNDGTEQSQTLDIMDGERGEQGIQGETGATGATGAQGIQGIQGIQGAKGDKGDKGDQGIQGVQGIQGAKGDDGYPFLIYKQYDDISEFTESDFPEIGLMFMVMQEDFDPDDPTTSIGYPIYRYTGVGNPPYSLVVHLASQGIKGDKGDKGDQGVQGIQGEKGDKGDKGDQGIQGVQGVAGADGVDGTYITQIVKTATQGLVDTYTITLSDDSTFTFNVVNGADGSNGVDGVTPLASVSESDGVITISITDANGTTQESIDTTDFAQKSDVPVEKDISYTYVSATDLAEVIKEILDNQLPPATTETGTYFGQIYSTHSGGGDMGAWKGFFGADIIKNQPYRCQGFIICQGRQFNCYVSVLADGWLVEEVQFKSSTPQIVSYDIDTIGDANGNVPAGYITDRGIPINFKPDPTVNFPCIPFVDQAGHIYIRPLNTTWGANDYGTQANIPLKGTLYCIK
jgi:hypothetical protein